MESHVAIPRPFVLPMLYVRPFPGPGSEKQVSTTGGGVPQWRGDGRELFYRSAGSLMAVPVRTGAATLELGPAAALFAIDADTEYVSARTASVFSRTWLRKILPRSPSS